MDYRMMSKEELLERVMELEMLNKELMAEKEQERMLDFAWAGNLGHWYWNIAANSVVFNPLKVARLGYAMDELPQKVPFSFFTEKLHPDDYEDTMENMRRHMQGETEAYEVEYRIRSKEEGWKWFYDRGKITQRSPEGKPLFAAGIVFDITEKKEQEEKLKERTVSLEREATVDGLTGIRNRKAILRELENRVNQADMYKSDLAIILFDIDQFKEINDTKGHLTGDLVIKGVAGIISQTIRGLDSVGRYGGDEFLCILPNTSRENAVIVAERIAARVSGSDFGADVQVTVSGGIQAYSSQSIADLIDGADKNLYAAKNLGRNKVVL